MTCILYRGGAAVAHRKANSKDTLNKSMINLYIQKDNSLVVYAFDMQNLGDKAVYYPCWR